MKAPWDSKWCLYCIFGLIEVIMEGSSGRLLPIDLAWWWSSLGKTAKPSQSRGCTTRGPLCIVYQPGCSLPLLCPLMQRSPTFLTPGTDSMEDSFSTDWGMGGGWFQNDSSGLHLLCSLFLFWLHQLCLRPSGIRSWRLGTPAVVYQ